VLGWIFQNGEGKTMARFCPFIGYDCADFLTSSCDDYCEMKPSTISIVLTLEEYSKLEEKATMLEALEWANDDTTLTCDVCPMTKKCSHDDNDSWCEVRLMRHTKGWFDAYREKKYGR
jgi:hypothetical protein